MIDLDIEFLTRVVRDEEAPPGGLLVSAEALGRSIQGTTVIPHQGEATLRAAEVRSAAFSALLGLRNHADPLAREGAARGLGHIHFRENQAREAMRKTLNRWLRRERVAAVRIAIEEAMKCRLTKCTR